MKNIRSSWTLTDKMSRRFKNMKNFLLAQGGKLHFTHLWQSRSVDARPLSHNIARNGTARHRTEQYDMTQHSTALDTETKMVRRVPACRLTGLERWGRWCDWGRRRRGAARLARKLLFLCGQRTRTRAHTHAHTERERVRGKIKKKERGKEREGFTGQWLG